jgi:PucR family transcriptional regulator, purine catabolism regulatory protein
MGVQRDEVAVAIRADGWAERRVSPGAQYPPAPSEARHPMPLWLPELLEDVSLGAELVAGRAGVTRRGPIRWAHITELPDPTPWLEGGELLLTTGLGIRDDPDLQERFVAGIARRGVVALGFAVGVSLEHVPDALVAACDHHALPLFTMPYEIPFIAVSRRVAHHAFAEHYATLRRAVDLHRQVLAAVVSDGGVSAVLATVARAMPGVALVAFDFSGQELARADPAGTATTLPAPRLWAAAPRGGARSTLTLAGRSVTSAAVVVGDHLEALVVAVSRAPLLEHEELLFEQGVAGVSLELARHRSVRDARRTRVEELLEEVATGRSTAGLVERALARLGVDAPGRYRVLACDVADTTSATQQALCGLVEDAVVAFGPPVVGRIDGVVHALVPADEDVAGAVLAAATRRGWTGLTIGRSRIKTELDALRAALREAGVALHLDGPAAIRDVDSLGLPGLLAGIRDDLGAGDFVTQVLGPVIEHDRRESAQLVATLRAYLAHGCRPGPAAEELCIHRHTLAYRLERIRELTGNDPRSGAHLVAYGLALELLDRDGP